MSDPRQERLAEFVTWTRAHVTGDEKGQAQIFLDHLFRAFGQKGSLDVGGSPEMRVRKAEEDGGGTTFADYVWKPVVLIEMKRRGVDLSKHFRQAFDYWIRLVPNRPQYAVLSNFDEFWVYDFNVQMDAPVDKVTLDELPTRYGPLAFLFPTNETPVFGNDQEAVTRKAADLLGTCFHKLIIRGVPRDLAQSFTLQMLVALFAEDIGLLEKYFVTRLLEECHTPADAYDKLGNLFEAMNTPGGVRGGRFKGVDYFNGGLFRTPARLELQPDELAQLRAAADSNWSQVRPEIFGAIFEASMDQGERHAFGAHFTSPVDIMKIVGPTIVEPWRALIENATTVKEMNGLLARMHDYHVLDPACGSGNFLYIAYREMKRLEVRAYERLAELSKKRASQQGVFGFVTADQFYGMDINPFAVELAKVTMMIGRKLSIEELHITEPALPLDNLDGNFVIGDALINDGGQCTEWPRADVIIGNPPFLGAKRLKPEHGPDYVNAIRRLYPEVPGMADFCVYWFNRANHHLPLCTSERPERGRAGLVGTQNIRNNKSREGGLDHIVRTGTIVEAVDNQPWSGEANVHVSIANWVKHTPSNEPADRSPKSAGTSPADRKKSATKIDEQSLLIPAKRKLWFKVEPAPGLKKPKRRGSGPANKEYELDFESCPRINAALSHRPSVSEAVELTCSTRPQRVFQGVTPGHDGFVLSPTERNELLSKDGKSNEVVFPYLVGRELLSGSGQPERFLIDFQQRSIFEAKECPAAFNRIETLVLPKRESNAKKDLEEHGEVRSHHKSFLDRWWKLAWDRADLLAQIGLLHGRYLVCSRVTKRPIFTFVSSAIRPGDALQCFAFDDDYSFGILQSNAHWQWFVAKCSKLKSDFRYTPESVFDTFPWPQSPANKLVTAVAEAGREVRRVRDDALTKVTGGLRAVYRTLELPGKNPLKEAHAALDAAVLEAYAFSPKKDLLAQLLDLNLAVASDIEQNKPVTPPGVPPGYSSAKSLVTSDCIRV